MEEATTSEQELSISQVYIRVLQHQAGTGILSKVIFVSERKKRKETENDNNNKHPQSVALG